MEALRRQISFLLFPDAYRQELPCDSNAVVPLLRHVVDKWWILNKSYTRNPNGRAEANRQQQAEVTEQQEKATEKWDD